MVITQEDVLNSWDDFKKEVGYNLEDCLRMRSWSEGVKNRKSYKKYINSLKRNESMRNTLLSAFSEDEIYFRNFSWEIDDPLNYSGDIEEFVSNLLNPEIFRDTSLWALFILLERVSYNFSDTVLSIQKLEPALTELLFDRVNSNVEKTREIEHILNKTLPVSCGIFSIDLQVKRREKKTGGDILLFIEHDGTIIPVVIQSKRFEGKNVDISQASDDGVYQFDTLRKGLYPSAYLFFENPEYAPEEGNLPPLLKVTSDIECKGEPTTTSAYEKTLTLGEFLIKMLRDELEYNFSNIKEAMDSVLPKIDIRNLQIVAVCSSTENASIRFQNEWDKNDIIKRLINEDRPPSVTSDFKM